MKGRRETGGIGTDDKNEDEATESGRGGGGKEKKRGKKGERKLLTRGTYTQSLSADHQIDVLVYFPVLVLGLGAVADRVVCVGVRAVTAV